jgi:hypothetical protein
MGADFDFLDDKHVFSPFPFNSIPLPQWLIVVAGLWGDFHTLPLSQCGARARYSLHRQFLAAFSKRTSPRKMAPMSARAEEKRNRGLHGTVQAFPQAADPLPPITGFPSVMPLRTRGKCSG